MVRKILILALFLPFFLYAEINHIKVINLSENKAVLQWHTDVLTTGKIFYGKFSNRLYNQGISLGYATNHSAILNNMEKGSVYYYYIESTDEKGKIEKTDLFQLKTKGIPDTKLLSLSIITNEETYFVLRWEANVPIKASVLYIQYGNSHKKETKFTKPLLKGRIRVDGLIPKTSYYYLFQYKDQSGKVFKDKIKTIVTKENNVALHKSVKGTFNKNIKNDKYFQKSSKIIKRVTDGKMDYFTGMAVSGNIKKTDQLVIIDLKDYINIDSIDVFWRALSYSTDYKILISLDKKNWKTVKKKLNAAKGKKMRGEKGDPILYNTIFVHEKARYIKLIASKNQFYNKHEKWDYVQLMEIKVYPKFQKGGDAN